MQLFYLCLLDSAHRADAGASAAVCADVGIDLVDVASGDSLYRAFADAGAASNAIVSDFVSHNNYFGWLVS